MITRYQTKTQVLIIVLLLERRITIVRDQIEPEMGNFLVHNFVVEWSTTSEFWLAISGS